MFCQFEKNQFGQGICFETCLTDNIFVIARNTAVQLSKEKVNLACWIQCITYSEYKIYIIGSEYKSIYDGMRSIVNA